MNGYTWICERNLKYEHKGAMNMQKNILITVTSFLLMCPNIRAYFDTLKEITAYAAMIPSDTPNQSVEPYHPQFNKFHRAIPRLTEQPWLAKFGFRQHKLIPAFKKLVQSITKQRELTGFFGDFVQKFYIENETKWYIWGALHGAFHSLVRDLGELKKIHMLADDLSLLQTNIYLVFNGELINYGAYQIETLQVILKLAEKNPSRVLLIRGKSEQEGMWQKTNFSNELRTRLGVLGKKIPLENEIGALFDTFAWAVYLLSTEGDVARISCFEQHPLLQEKMWGSFLSKKATEFIQIRYIPQVPFKQPIKTLITTHIVKEVPYRIQSMSYDIKNGISQWSLF